MTTTEFLQGKFKSGHTLKDSPICPEMVVIPATIFTMGSLGNESGHAIVEEPRKRISIAQFAADIPKTTL